MSVIDQVKNKADIVEVISEYVDLQKKGKNYWGICPFHQDSNPSMSVSPEKQMFKCFTCGAGGSVIGFVADYEKIPFGKALVKLAEKYDIKIDQNKYIESPRYNDEQLKLINALNDAMNYFQYSISTEEGSKALAYAESRGMDIKIREKFSIGYAPGHGLKEFLLSKGHDEATLINASLINDYGRDFLRDRLVYAIENKFGDVVGVSGRILSGEGPKYINSIESRVFNKSSIFYNINNAIDVIKKQKELIINEGFNDVIAMSKAGFNNSVAIMGTALTHKHLSFIKGKKVVLWLDSDKAGINASVKSIKLLLKNKIKTSVVFAKDAKDPDEVFIEKGEKGISNLLENKISGLEFIFNILLRECDVKHPEGISEFIRRFAEYLTESDEIEKDFYVNKISELFKVSSEIVYTKIPKNVYTKVKLEVPKEVPQYIPPEPTMKAPIENIEVIKQTEEASYKPRNFSFLLIRSMLKKSSFVDVLRENPVNFTDAMILNVVKYIAKIKKAKENGREFKMDAQYNKKIHEILREDDTFVDTKNEFLDIINILNKNASMSFSNRIISKDLKEAKDSELQDDILERLVQANKKG